MRFRSLLFLLLIFVGPSCVTTPRIAQETALTSAEIVRRVPPSVKDRVGWARDIEAAIAALTLAPTEERVCAVVAVIEQESNFHADPATEHLPQIVRKGLEAKLSRLGVLARPAVAALWLKYGDRIDALKSEHELDLFYRELVGFQGLDGWNPVTTVGSMQVKVTFARTLDEFSGMSDTEVRDALYTRAAGVRAGTARLLGYPASYDTIRYRFADYNSGIYASRNAAFQKIVVDLTGRPLKLDGDILDYEKGGESESLRALLAFGRRHDFWDWTVRRAAGKEKSEDFEETSLWDETRAIWKEKHGKEPPYAQIPEVVLESPKLARPRSTTWFVSAVERRYERCRSR